MFRGVVRQLLIWRGEFSFLKLKKKYKKKNRRRANKQGKRSVFRTKEMTEIKMKDQVIRKERKKGRKEEIKKRTSLLLSNAATCI